MPETVTPTLRQNRNQNWELEEGTPRQEALTELSHRAAYNSFDAWNVCVSSEGCFMPCLAGTLTSSITAIRNSSWWINVKSILGSHYYAMYFRISWLMLAEEFLPPQRRHKSSLVVLWWTQPSFWMIEKAKQKQKTMNFLLRFPGTFSFLLKKCLGPESAQHTPPLLYGSRGPRDPEWRAQLGMSFL